MSQTATTPSHYVSSHGATDAVLKYHSWRTVENSAPHLIPYLKPDLNVLDVGCGPGTITLDLASRVPQGRVTGVDYAASAIERARANAADKKIGNVSFEVGDIFALPFADDTFDLTHAHQVLQHIVDPVKALREIRRVTKPGGIVALRETDVQTFVFYPETEGLTRWVRQLSGELGRRHGCEPEAGRRLHAWARQAGFDSASMDRSVGSWCFSTAEERHFWGGSIINRLENSSLPATAVEKGLATAEEIKETVQALKDWIADEDGWFALMHGQLIARA